MSLSAASLIVNIADPEANGLLGSFFSQQPAPQGIYFRNDIKSMPVYAVRPADGSSTLYWLPVTLNAAYLSLGIGDGDVAPESGIWGLSFNADTTGLTGLVLATTEANLQTAINANPAVVTDYGGASATEVELIAEATYQVTWGANGARPLFGGNPAGLTPVSNVFVSRFQVGDADQPEIQIIQLVQRPYVYVSSWTPTAAVSASVIELRAGAGGAKGLYQITISPLPYRGTFTVKGSSGVAFNATEEAMLTSLGEEWGSVLKTGDSTWTIERAANGEYTLVSGDIDVSGLSVYSGLIGTLGFNAAALYKKFLTTSGRSFQSTLSARYYDGSERETLLDISVTLTKDILSVAGLAPINWNNFYYTQTQADARFSRSIRAITGLTGGGATKLDGLTTAAGEWDDKPPLILITGTPPTETHYCVFDGTDAESSPTVIRPDDYATTTNERVWKLVL